ncbi:MAG TPA: ATP-binding protein, partial [Holophagaceae bacterium]|nr:ATP-binding protein [Holophagaceae bacterium]
SPRGRPTLWLGTQTGGLASLDLQGWGSFGMPQGLPDPDVTAIAETMDGGDGVMWFGTSGGLAHFQDGRWSIESTKDGLPSGQINAVMPGLGLDGRPGLWVATLKGLALRQGEHWTTFARQRGPRAEDQVNCVLQTRDREGRTTLWAGTGSGLDRLRDGTWTRLTPKDGLAGYWISALLETRDADGGSSLWAGCRGGGLARLKDGRWSRASAADGLPAGSINTVFETRGSGGRHWLWVGTLGGGLGRLALDEAGARWERLTTHSTPALPNDDVFRFEQDRQGRLYLSTNQGVARLTLRDPGDALGTAAIEYQGREDGLPSRFCALGASTVDHLGRIWIGTVKGAAMLDPALELPPAGLPSPVLQRALVDSRETRADSGLALKPGEHQLAFEYLLPGFDHPMDVRYRTQVVGLEDAPTPWTAQGRRELTALPPGDYVFRVWARDHLGRETQPVDLRFEVKPPAWRSPLAITFYALAAGLVLLTLHRLRLRLLKDHARRLEAEVARATEEVRTQQRALAHFNEQLTVLNEQKSRMLGIAAHDLRNPLQSIFSMTELLELGDSGPEELTRTTRRIQDAAEEMAQLIRKLLDVSAIEDGSLNLRLEAVDVSELARSVAAAEEHRATAKGMVIEVLQEGEGPLVRADRFYLKEVLTNLLGNAVKFTPPGPPLRHIRLRLGAEGAWGILEVQDEGPGFSAEDRKQLFGRFARLSARPTGGERSTGLGLSIVKSLVETMGGGIELADLSGPGATFRLRLPLEPSAPDR